MKRILLTGMISLLVFMVGCALSNHQVRLENTTIETTGIGAKKPKADFNQDFYQGAVVFVTKNIVYGNVTVFQTKESPMEVAEFHAGKIRTQGLVIDGDKEYFNQSVICDVEDNEDLFDYGNLVESTTLSSQARIYRVSAAAEIGYDAQGNYFSIDTKKFKKDKSYRKLLAQEHGTLVNECKSLYGWSKTLESWNRVSTENGLGVYPGRKDENFKIIQYLASLNSADTYPRKFVASAKIDIQPLDLRGTLIGLFEDAIRAAKYPSFGPNFGSAVPKRLELGQINQIRHDVIKKFRLIKKAYYAQIASQEERSGK